MLLPALRGVRYALISTCTVSQGRPTRRASKRRSGARFSFSSLCSVHRWRIPSLVGNTFSGL